MYYKQNQNIDESRFIDGDITKIHDLLKSDYNIINEHWLNIMHVTFKKYISILIRIWLGIEDWLKLIKKSLWFSDKC